MRMPNGYGSIFKLSGKRRRPWCVRLACKYVSDGDAIREERPILGYYATKQEAIQALADYNRSPYDVSSKATFKEAFDMWMKTQKFEGKAADRYYYALGKCSEIADMPISELRHQHYQAILDKYAHQSATSVRYILAAMRKTSQYAFTCEIIPKDYTTLLKADHNTSAEDVHHVFSEEEIDNLWASEPSELRDLTLILLYTGFRVNELLKMKPENIDLSAMTLRGGSKTKAGKDRLVPIHSRIQPIMMKYGSGFSTTYDSFYTALKAHTGHIPHDTRHTFISRMQTAGADNICIKRLVGHITKDITIDVYTHKDIDELRRNIELLQ